MGELVRGKPGLPKRRPLANADSPSGPCRMGVGDVRASVMRGDIGGKSRLLKTDVLPFEGVRCSTGVPSLDDGCFVGDDLFGDEGREDSPGEDETGVECVRLETAKE